MGEDKRYNGWANYETWAVSLWQDNEETSYLYAREAAREAIAAAAECDQVRDGIWPIDRAPVFILADRLKSEYDDARPDVGASVWADLLSAALGEVNWHEIAEQLINEVKFEEGES